MKAVLLLALVAAANAAFFAEEVPLGYDDYVPVAPMLTRAMFTKFGFAKPPLDAQFISFGRSMGASDSAIARMHALYDEPAVLFFLDSADGIVSYYAAEGVDSAMFSPELRSVFPSVLGAADSMAVVYKPESFLGSYKSVLPGHFFMPSHSAGLAKIMREAYPLPMEHAIFRRSEIADIFPEVSPIYAKFDIDEFPYAYKQPVALRLLNSDFSFAPSSSALFAKAFPAFSAPRFNSFAKSAYPISAAHSPAFIRSSFPFIRSEIPAYASEIPVFRGIPAYSSEIPAYHSEIPVFRSEIPAFHSAIPVLKFPFRHYAPYEHLVYAKPSYKILPYSVAPIAPAPLVATPTVEAAPAEASELRGYPFFLRGAPSFYPTYSPALRYPAPAAFFPAPTPIVPTASGVAGASAAAKASASSVAGAGVSPLF